MKWSASLICADLFMLQRDLETLSSLNVDFLHLDFMDGLFVPRLGMYPEMIQKLKEQTTIPIEAHLMLQNPEPYIASIQQAGADVITVHPEACHGNTIRTLELIKKTGAKAGLALNPGTEWNEINYAEGLVDYLLIMGINPGILGQKIKPFIIGKIKKYRDLFLENNLAIQIIIDGGVNFENYQILFEAGADILVGGSQTIFHPGRSVADNLLELKARSFVGCSTTK